MARPRCRDELLLPGAQDRGPRVVSSPPRSHPEVPFRRWTPRRQELAILLLDASAVVIAFYAAYLVRFEGNIPPERLSQFWRCLGPLVAIRLLLYVVVGIHRWSFRLSGFHEAVRLVQASFMGSTVFLALFYFIQRVLQDVSIGPPLSV